MAISLRMNKEYREKELPQWFKEINKEEYFLVLSNDIDSLLTCAFLNNKFGLEIGGYYSFDSLYKNTKVSTEGKKPIYIDADMVKGLCFGNHVTVYNNPKAITLNKSIKSQNYTDKYAGSTLLMVMSLFDFDFSTLSEKELVLLSCVDSAFLGYYNSRFNSVWRHWHEDILEIDGLSDVLHKYTSEELNGYIDNYSLRNCFYIKEGKLYRGGVKVANFLSEVSMFLIDDLQLSTSEWELKKNFKQTRNRRLESNQIPISSSRTYKNSWVISYIENKNI